MGQGLLQIILTLVILMIILPSMGKYMADVFLGETTLLSPILEPIEEIIYRLGGLLKRDNMTASQYIRSVLLSNLCMGILTFIILNTQDILPFNLHNLNSPNWDLTLHTTISFLTNTDQQHYSGENTLSNASQIYGLGFLMFVSAATGLSVVATFLRGITGRPLGNYWLDLVQVITRILLPISFVSAIALLILGVPETLQGTISATGLEGHTQLIARGPIAHFEAIKQLGENGGGFFGANSAHPFENPNGATNLIETILMLLIPSSLIYTYGVMAGNLRQAWLLLGMVFTLFIGLISISAIAEFAGNPLVNQILGEQVANLEGKEVRFGWTQSTLWAVTTTATMCGAVNSMLDSFMPMSILVIMFNMFIQIIFGGQGTGTVYLLIMVILTVFITGLLVGRTPEFLGRKIEKREIILASVILLIHPIAILIPGAITLAFPEQLAGISNPSFHGLSQVIYEYTSAGANNGSGLEGLADNTPWWNLTTSLSLLMGRYIPIIALIFLAEGMLQKQVIPNTEGTLRTDTLLFTLVTAGIILILGALTFFPVLALGPIAEAFEIMQKL